MWYLYVLICADKSLYTGITNDLEKRFLAHQSGRGGAYTRSHKPIKIVYTETHSTQSDALKREIEIKSWPRAKKLQKLGIISE